MGTPTPLFRGNPFTINFAYDFGSPTENASYTGISVGKKLGYNPGNSALIINSGFPTNRFEAIVTFYDKNTGLMNINQVTNIRGSTFGLTGFTISLAGERGGNLYSGSGTPGSSQGRVGDWYMNTVSGDLYIKS